MGDAGGFMMTANCGTRSSPKGIPTTQERQERIGSAMKHKDDHKKERHHKDENWRRESKHGHHRLSKSLEPGKERHHDKHDRREDHGKPGGRNKKKDENCEMQ